MDSDTLWDSGEQSLLLALQSRYFATPHEHPWNLVASEMSKLCSSLTNVSLCSENSSESCGFRQHNKYTAKACEAQFSRLTSNETTEQITRTVIGSRLASLRHHLESLKEQHTKITNMIASSDIDFGDPFTQEQLRRFSKSLPAGTVKIDRRHQDVSLKPEDAGATKGSAVTHRGRKRSRTGLAADSHLKESPIEQQSPSRTSSRSLSIKKSVGSPSPACPGRTRSTANLGSSPATPVAIQEEEKVQDGHRMRSGSRSSQLPPLVIRIPPASGTQHPDAIDAVSPKFAVASMPSPSLTKSPMTRQQKAVAGGAECPTSPALAGSRPHTPVSSPPPVAAALSVSSSRRSPRVAGGQQTSLAKPTMAITDQESPGSMAFRRREFSPQPHRSRSKSDASSIAAATSETTPADEPSIIESGMSASKSASSNAEQAATDDRPARMTRRLLMQMWRSVLSHRHSPIFLNPVTEDIAPNYSQIVYKPKDLSTIRQQIESGKISSVAELQLELMVMFQNALMYNGREHTVHQMAADMYDDVMQHFEAYSSSTDRRETVSTGPGGTVKKGSRSRRRHSEVDGRHGLSTSIPSDHTPTTLSENSQTSMVITSSNDNLAMPSTTTILGADAVVTSAVVEDANMEVAAPSPPLSELVNSAKV